MIKKTILILMTSILSSSISFASGLADLAGVKEKLNATFSNFSATYVKESPLPGLFEIHTANGIIYFSPEEEVMVFGRIYNKDGQDLTQLSLSNAVKSRMDDNTSIKELLMSGVSINQGGDIKLTVFSNPDCGYCQRFDAWLPTIEQAKDLKVEQNIVFMRNSGFSASEAKMKHVICSDNPTQAYREMHTLPASKLIDCPEAEATLKKHDELIQFFGVQGTPTFLTESGELITGFKTERLSDVISHVKEK